MKLDASTERKIQELQVLEQQTQSFLMEKQSLQVELNEMSNAVEEIKKTKDDVYQILGGIMLKADKTSLMQELEKKKKLTETHVTAIEKQEKLLNDKATSLREQISKVIQQ